MQGGSLPRQGLIPAAGVLIPRLGRGLGGQGLPQLAQRPLTPLPHLVKGAQLHLQGLGVLPPGDIQVLGRPGVVEEDTGLLRCVGGEGGDPEQVVAAGALGGEGEAGRRRRLPGQVRHVTSI